MLIGYSLVPPKALIGLKKCQTSGVGGGNHFKLLYQALNDDDAVIKNGFDIPRLSKSSMYS